jgi:hypothetical protein
MKKITKFLLNVTSVGSILSIATLNALQLTVVGQPTPNVDGQPITQPGRVRFVGPAEDNLSSPNSRLLWGVHAGLTCDSRGKRKLTALVPKSQIGRTVSEYPVFFFYLPKCKDSGLKEGNEVRHRKVVTRMGIHSLTEKSHY